MSTLVAIPVYERAEQVRHCFATLAELQRPDGTTIVVFDDCSQTFDPGAMAAEAGIIAVHDRRPFRIGADAMIYLMWSTFLASGADTLLMVDSDMIANRTALVDGLALLGGVDGLLSLYNSIRHPAIEEAGELVYKRRLGNAGTLWTRELVALVRGGVEPGNFMDDRYCIFLRQRGLRLASTRRSRLQHLGHGGQNNRYFGDLDHGAGFVADSAPQQAALVEAYDELMSRQPFYRPPGVLPAAD